MVECPKCGKPIAQLVIAGDNIPFDGQCPLCNQVITQAPIVLVAGDQPKI